MNNNKKISKTFLKKSIIPLIFLLIAIFLVIFSKDNIIAANKALKLWATTVIPSLLPFLIIVELLTHTPLLKILNKICTPLMKPIFNVSGEGAFALIMGILSGYPVGAKIVSNLKKNNRCTKTEAERLIAFTNNSGPLFIIGTVGVSLFGDTRTGILLFITHLLGSLTVGLIFRFYKYNDYEIINNKKSEILYKENCNFSNLGKILTESIISGINTILLIGGYVLIFSIITTILKNIGIIKLLSILITPILNLFNISLDFSIGILSGFLELTNGINIVSLISNHYINTNIVIVSFLLGFGGISILLQVYSIIAEEEISIRPYIIGKIFHGIISSIYTFLLLKYTKFFNLDAITTFSDNNNIDNSINKIISENIEPNMLCLYIFIIFYLIYFFISLKNNKKL